PKTTDRATPSSDACRTSGSTTARSARMRWPTSPSLLAESIGHNNRRPAPFTGASIGENLMNVVLATLLLACAPQETKFSGPQKGEKAPGFKVFDVGSRQDVDYVADA